MVLRQAKDPDVEEDDGTPDEESADVERMSRRVQDLFICLVVVRLVRRDKVDGV